MRQSGIVGCLTTALDSNALSSALTKIDGFNARFGTPMNIDKYVSNAERTRFHNAFLRMANAR